MKTPKKEIARLRKSRLWPSLLLFIGSLLMGAILLAVEFCIYASYVVESKYMQALTSSQSIARSIEDLQRQGETWEEAFASSSLVGEHAVAVCDAQGRVVAARGEVTADLTRPVRLMSGGDADMYFDHSMIDLAMKVDWRSWLGRIGIKISGSDDLTNVDAIDIMVGVLLSRSAEAWQSIGNDMGDITRALTSWQYWQSVPLSGDESMLLVKNEIIIRMDDLIFGIGITGVSGLMFLSIISAQFMNVKRKVHEHRRLERLLLMDSVTGGNNRMAFMQKAERQLQRGPGFKRTFAVVDLTVAKYQGYCSLHGAEAGERLQERLARFMEEEMGRREVCGHISGPDFALLLQAETGEAGHKRAIERLMLLFEDMEKSVRMDGDHCHISFQAGVCFQEALDGDKEWQHSLRGADIETLYMNAGMARSSVAADESETIACFSRQMRSEQEWQHKVESSMQAALDNEEFQVYVQPKYNPNSGRLEGGEALVRWLSPTEGMIPPGRFVPIFEKTGFVTKLDDYMISHIARLQGQWLREGLQIVPISVNVSRAHFVQPDLAEHIRDLVDVYGVPHQFIEIELTESAFFDDKKALLSTVHRLQSYGFDVSMDDFGSGYSSLNSLKDLPLNVLKLDADFFRGEGFDGRGEIVVSEAITLAKHLNMRIVAEGVEKKEQVDFLARQDCDMVQGYYYAKPMPAGEYADRLEMLEKVPDDLPEPVLLPR